MPARRAARGRLAVYRLINTFSGWDTTHTPVADCDWAIDQVAVRYPSAPVGLVGHSLGGRAALVAGDNPAVRSVAVLNPWLYPADDPDLSGRSVLFVHGGRDRIASIGKAEAVARRLTRRTSVGFIRIPDGKHSMLRHGSAYDRYAASFTAAVLLGDPTLASVRSRGCWPARSGSRSDAGAQASPQHAGPRPPAAVRRPGHQGARMRTTPALRAQRERG